MKTLFASSTLCTVISIMGDMVISMVGFDENPTPWDAWSLIGTALLLSAFFWSVMAIWSGLQLQKMEPPSVALWLRIILIIVTSAYALTLLSFVIVSIQFGPSS
jgi:hypothetical protein